MITYDDLERDLQDLLNHLYDPDLEPGEAMRAALGQEAPSPEDTRAFVVQAIDGLAPEADVPPRARVHRLHEILHARYVMQLSQEHVAERLAITPRHLRREQRQAVALLARRLWQGYAGAMPELGDADAGLPANLDNDTWRSQVKEEMASLHKSVPGAITDVGESIGAVIGLLSPLLTQQGKRLTPARITEGVEVAMHPSALRQVLVSCISGIMRHEVTQDISLGVSCREGQAEILVRARPATLADVPDSHVITEILSIGGGTIDASAEGDILSLRIRVPIANDVTVLVVEDNADLVHFYHRYTEGTRYSIVHLAEGERLFEAMESIMPDIVVLDVMLADVDGWELLAQLHAHGITRHVPVIICSVVREAELAMSLGASVYVSKPIGRSQFIAALDQALAQVLDPAGSAGPVSPESTATDA
jgi:CheY-like chemotaxis protein